MPSKAKVVKIERGQYGPTFQVVRAWLSAASALASVDPKQARRYIESAEIELKLLKAQLGGAM